MRPTRVMGLAGLSIAMLGASANAEIDSEFGLGYHTEYIFRGYDMGDNLVDFSLDFSGTCDCGVDWNAGLWYGDYSDAGTEDEMDIYLGISKDFNGVTLSTGFIRYSNADTNNDLTEVYFGAATSFNAIDLDATLFWNVSDENGDATGDLYLELTASQSFEISDGLSAEFGLTVAFFDSDQFVDDGLANYGAYLALNKQVSEDITISPYIQVVENDSDYNNRDYLVGGIRTSFNF